MRLAFEMMRGMAVVAALLVSLYIGYIACAVVVCWLIFHVVFR